MKMFSATIHISENYLGSSNISFFLKYSWFPMLCYFQVYELSDSAVCVYIYILFQLLFFYRLLQNIKYSSLCCAVGPCWLSISCIVYSMYVLVPNS